MILRKALLIGACALGLGGPALAQWPPPPPPFVSNPGLAPPAMRPVAPAPQARAMTRAQQRAARQAERQRLRQERRMKTMRCRQAAEQQDLRGRARRAFIARCEAN